jgi:hypothetical protein
LLHPLTVGDNPNCVQSSPNFAKPPGRYLQATEAQSAKEVERKNKNINY